MSILTHLAPSFPYSMMIMSPILVADKVQPHVPRNLKRNHSSGCRQRHCNESRKRLLYAFYVFSSSCNTHTETPWVHQEMLPIIGYNNTRNLMCQKAHQLELIKTNLSTQCFQSHRCRDSVTMSVGPQPRRPATWKCDPVTAAGTWSVRSARFMRELGCWVNEGWD